MPVEMELSSEDKAAMNDMKQQDAALGPMEPKVEEAPQEPAVEQPRVEQPKVEEAPAEPVVEEKAKRLVPLSELQEERKERRAAQERLDAIMAKLTQQPEPQIVQKPVIDPDQDPMGALKSQAEEIKELRAFRQEQERQAQMYNAAQQTINHSKAQEIEFAKETPDYNEAGNFLRNLRMNQLKAVGYDQERAHRMVAQETLNLANQMIANNKNVASSIYELAKQSGYQRKAAEAPVVDKLDRIEAGQRANVSLTNGNGVQQKTGQLDAKAILAMPDDKFEQFLGKLSKSDRQDVLGR